MYMRKGKVFFWHISLFFFMVIFVCCFFSFFIPLLCFLSTQYPPNGTVSEHAIHIPSLNYTSPQSNQAKLMHALALYQVLVGTTADRGNI